MKKITSLLLMLFVVFGLQAQTMKVQGVPRQLAKSAKADPAVVYPNIDFGDLDYVVGSGKYLSALVIKWDDGKGGNCNLVWGYQWTTSEQGTGEAMLRAVAKADPRFYMLVYGNTQYGSAIGGMGFDLNGNGNIALLKNGVSYPLTDGLYNSSAYDFDSYTSNDPADHWQSGWMNGYWSYWSAADVSQAFEYSQVGASSRMLTDGSIDGWSFMSNMSDWYSNDMSGKVCYVSKPATTGNVSAYVTESKTTVRSIQSPQTRSRVLDGIVTVQTMEDFYKCIDEAADGDTIQFEPNLRGTVVKDASEESHDIIGKNITLIGHGVIIEGGAGLFFDQINKCVISDFTFRNFNQGTRAIHANCSNILIEKCAFENSNSTQDGIAIKYEDLQDEQDYTMNVYNCRFSNNTTSKQGVVYIGTNNNASKNHKLSVNIVSCTFEGNQAGTRGNSIAVINYPTVKIANCVFENDHKDNGLPTIGLNRPNKLPAGQFKMAYNLVEGSVSTPEDEIKRLSDTDYCAASFDNDVLTLANGEYLVVKNGLAYNRFPANTSIEGITMPAKDITGAAIDYSKATHTGACQQVFGTNTEVDYSKGVFVVNEDWFGHQNSTVNFLTDQGEWYYRVFQKENEGMELGGTSNFGTIYGDKFYIVSKQDKDPGATITGGRLTVCDARTLKCIKQFPVISEKDGKSNADGRAFLGVNEHKGYISTSNGIYIFDMDNVEIKGQVTGSGNPNDDPYGSVYKGQVGTMIRVNEKVFAVHQSAGLLVIDAEADTLITTVKAPKEMVNGKEVERGFGSVVLSKDGNLWLSVAANTTGSGATVSYIFKVNPATCDTTRVNLPEGIYPPANSWYAWTADGFCSSKQNNCLYWNGGEGSWFAGMNIVKYDIDRNEFRIMASYENTGWKIYGACLRVDPVSDNLYVSLYHDFQDPTHVLFKYDNAGNELAQYSMINNYWFPALPVFPDNESPVLIPVSPEIRDSHDPFVISLAGLATDPDNQDAAIVKSVKNISDEQLLAATVVDGDLKVTPKGGKGTAEVTLKVNSNGKVAESVVSIEITKEGSGIDGETVVRSVYGNGRTLYINHCEGFRFALYTAGGQLIRDLNVENECFTVTVDLPAGIYYLKGTNGKETSTFKVILN